MILYILRMEIPIKSGKISVLRVCGVFSLDGERRESATAAGAQQVCVEAPLFSLSLFERCVVHAYLRERVMQLHRYVFMY